MSTTNDRLAALAGKLQALSDAIATVGLTSSVQRKAADLYEQASKVHEAFAAERQDPARPAAPYDGFPVGKALESAMLVLGEVARGGGDRADASARLRRIAGSLRVATDTRWPRWLRALSPAKAV